MTRKHYEMTARALRAEYRRGTLAEKSTIHEAAIALAAAYAADNPRFDEYRFIVAVTEDNA